MLFWLTFTYLSYIILHSTQAACYYLSCFHNCWKHLWNVFFITRLHNWWNVFLFSSYVYVIQFTLSTVCLNINDNHKASLKNVQLWSCILLRYTNYKNRQVILFVHLVEIPNCCTYFDRLYKPTVFTYLLL